MTYRPMDAYSLISAGSAAGEIKELLEKALGHEPAPALAALSLSSNKNLRISEWRKS